MSSGDLRGNEEAAAVDWRNPLYAKCAFQMNGALEVGSEDAVEGRLLRRPEAVLRQPPQQWASKSKKMKKINEKIKKKKKK